MSAMDFWVSQSVTSVVNFMEIPLGSSLLNDPATVTLRLWVIVL